jgi:uncharacterized membrane protein YhaH (DUF805 family)
MSFVDAIKSGFRNYAKFRGRASRSEYWWFFLFTVLAQTVGSAIDESLGNIAGLVVFLPGLALHVRRIHDTGRSGWWVGAFYASIGVLIVSVVTLIIDAAIDFEDFDNSDFFGENVSGGSAAFLGLASIGVLVLLIVNIVFLCQRSQPSENRFGPPPPPKVL